MIGKIHTDKNRIISLKDRSDRYNRVKDEFEKHGIDHDLFVGINGKKLGLFYTKRNPEWFACNHGFGQTVEVDMIPTTRCPFPKSKMAGMIGCFLSHYLIIQDAYMKGYERIAIFEDDVILDDNFIERLNKEIDDVPENRDVLFLGCNNQRGNSQTYHNKNVSIPNDVWGMHGYMLQGKGIKRLYELLSEGQTDHIDVMINRKFNKDLNIYTFVEPMCYQGLSESNIK